MLFDTLSYEFLAPGRIVFGWGRRREVGELARGLGRRVFVVSGSRSLERSGAIDEIGQSLRTGGLCVERLATICHEPLVADVDAAAAQIRACDPQADDLVLAIGGGSAIDLGKAVAALATNQQGASVADYLEGVGRGLTIAEPPLPIVALPTTGGTGAEATKNAVISSHDPPFKKSLRDKGLLPRLVVVDPELAVALPPTTTAHTGMDAITQLIEAYVSCRAQPIPQALALSGLQLASDWIEVAVQQGNSRPAREAMAQAALLSGMALANSGLGLAHGVAAALGIQAGIAHGLACAVMLPVTMRVNRPVRQAALSRLAEAMLDRSFSSEEAAAEAAIQRIDELCRSLAIPRTLSELGVQHEMIPALVAASRGNSMSGNPRQLSDEELASLLEEML